MSNNPKRVTIIRGEQRLNRIVRPGDVISLQIKKPKPSPA